MKSKKILLLYSRTGGGHLAVATAIKDEIEKRNQNIQVDLRDSWSDDIPPPLNKLPAWYPYLAKSKIVWQTIYELTEKKVSSAILKDAYSRYARVTIKKLFAEGYDLIISTHFGYNAPILDYAQKIEQAPPYIVIVTDYITAHRLWFDHRSTLCIVPSKEVQRRGLENGLSLEQMPIYGLPLKAPFEKKISKKTAESRLGWKKFNGLRVLLMGGGEGMGQMSVIAKKINAANIPLELVVVAGKNTALQQKLESVNWNISTRVIGFSKDIATLMNASDLVITKGGPTSILEAATLGKPFLIYDYLPGQEEGNVLAAVSSGAGQLLTDPDQLVQTLQRYAHEPKLLENFRAGSESLSQQGAAKRTVDRILDELQKTLPE